MRHLTELSSQYKMLSGHFLTPVSRRNKATWMVVESQALGGKLPPEPAFQSSYLCALQHRGAG